MTGAAGFVGRALLPMLAEAGYEVHAVSSRPSPGEPGDARWHQADLLEEGAAAKLVDAARPSHLVHLAWFTEHGEFWASPENHRWVEASFELWERFAAAGGERSVFAGTCAEYEWGEPVLAESTPLRPATLYGRCKDELRARLGEAAGAGTSVGWGRIFFPYGPGDERDRLIASVTRSLLAGSRAKATSGEQLRDFIYIDDVAAAFLALLQSDLREAVNVGSGTGATIRDVLERIGELTERPELIEFGAMPQREEEPRSIVADVSLISEQLGWRPRVGLSDGLERTVDALRREHVGANG